MNELAREARRLARLAEELADSARRIAVAVENAAGEAPVSRQSPAQPQEFFTVREVAEKLQCSRRLVYLWIQQERIPATKLGFKTYRIRADHLEEFLLAGLAEED